MPAAPARPYNERMTRFRTLGAVLTAALALWTTNNIGSIYGRHQSAPNAQTRSPWTWAGAAHSLAVEADAAGRLEMVAVGDNGVVWHRAQLPANATNGSGVTWSGWSAFGELWHP